MIGLQTLNRVFLCRTPTDMRKSFDGLCGCVEQQFQQDPLNGNLFVFFNRRSTMVKMLLWDRNGFWLFSKRLESGTFSLDSISQSGEADTARLLCILEGIDLGGSTLRKRFSLKKVVN